MMQMVTISNPFVVGRYVSDHYFCDREQETAFLNKQVENGRNVAMMAPRRMGKTGLIQHCFNLPQWKEKYYTFFVDIYATGSLAEFVYLLGKAVYKQSFDMVLGDIRTPEVTLREIFFYLESADKPCIVAIDEFQQIASYEEKNVEALLRTYIQQCRQTQFVFSGSRRHLMSQMFNSSSKPFYQSAISMNLEPIPMERYVTFAAGLFEEYGKQVDRRVIEAVYRRFEGCTWFVQMLMNELFALTPRQGRCDEGMLETAVRNVIESQEGSYKELLAHLAPRQKMVLQAIAKEGRVNGITSAAFIRKYNLPSASSVQAALKPLVKNDWVTQEGDTYRVYDYFWQEWLKREF